MSHRVRVDIWSDFACPWCYVGKRRFDSAVQQFTAAGGQVEVELHSFELSPDTPVDFNGSEVDFLASHRAMPPEQAAQMLAQMTVLAAAEGLAYDFAALQHTNTVRAHQLLHFAKAAGQQDQLAERLFSAYFTEGRHIGRVDDLADLAAEVGLDRTAAHDALTRQTYLPEVMADKQQAQSYGISAVPFFVIDQKFGVPGAQPTEVLVQALHRAAAEA